MKEKPLSLTRDKNQGNVLPFELPQRGDETLPEDEWAWLDVGFHNVTAETLGTAMIEAKFSLAIAPGRDAEWLALAVRRALAVSAIGEIQAVREQRSNAEIRDNLKSLADQTMKLYHALWSLPPDDAGAVDDILLADVLVGGESGASPFNRDREGLLGLYRTLMRASGAAAENKQGPGWRSAVERHQRVQMGRHLAPVFEAAFKSKPTASDHEHGPVLGPSGFVAFYKLVTQLVGTPNRNNDLIKVVKEAVNRHRRDPVRYEVGVIPGL